MIARFEECCLTEVGNLSHTAYVLFFPRAEAEGASTAGVRRGHLPRNSSMVLQKISWTPTGLERSWEFSQRCVLDVKVPGSLPAWLSAIQN